MAVSSGYDYGVRQGLVGRGVSNQDIGYNPTSGYVTVKGQNFMKPQKNYQGTTYTNQQDFNSAWDAYNKAQQTPVVNVQGTQQTPTGTAQTGGNSPYSTSNPYDTQLNDLMKTLMAQASNPAPVDVNSILASPQYAAYQANAQRAAQHGIRAAQESMGSAGFGRSTALGERAQGIQNEQDAYLNTQVIPQLMAQAQAEQQQKLQNQMAMLQQLVGQQSVHDNRYNNAQDLSLRQGEMTGTYLTPEAEATIQQIIDLGNAWGTASPEQRTQLNAEANRLRGLLPGMGVDPSLFGSNVSSADRVANLGRAGTRTMQGENFDRGVFEADRLFQYNEKRDQIADEQWKKEFDEDVRQFGIDDAWRKYQEKQIASRASGGGSSGGGSSNGVIQDLNKPRTVDAMITFIKNNTPGHGNLQGPPPPNMQEHIENVILSNPNLSEKQIKELYAKFGIPLPQ